MPIYYQKKSYRVTATVLHGDIRVGSTVFPKGDYLVQSDDESWFMTKKEFENTYEVAPFENTYEVAPPKWPRLSLDDYTKPLYERASYWRWI